MRNVEFCFLFCIEEKNVLKRMCHVCVSKNIFDLILDRMSDAFMILDRTYKDYIKLIPRIKDILQSMYRANIFIYTDLKLR